MVMHIFFKKFFRDLQESKGSFISVLAVVIIGVMFYTGMHSALAMMAGSGNTYFHDYRLADLSCTVHRAPETIIRRVRTIHGIKNATGRLIEDFRMSMQDRETIVRLIGIPDKDKGIVNDIQIKSGRYFSNSTGNQCLVSEDFFQAQQLKIGQTIEPIINGDRIKLKVIGTAKSPEYVYEVRSGNDMIPDPGKFGVVYVKLTYLQTIMDSRATINDISILLDDPREKRLVKENLKKLLKQYDLIGITEKKDQISFNAFNTDMTSLKSLATVFPLIFFIAAAVIIYITMTRMIENQRTQMGVLKALGYSNMAIMLHYQTYPILVGILGGIIGSVLGVMVIGRGMFNIFNNIYKVPAAQGSLHAGLAIPAAGLAIIFCVTAGYNACKRELALVPAQSIRVKPPATGKKMFLENIGLLWKNINFRWKIILRNLFRYKKRAAMASMGIIFSMALLLVAFGLRNSVDKIIDVQFSKVEKYDIKISFSNLMNTDELNYIRNIDHIKLMEPAVETGIEIKNGWIKKDVGLIALAEDSRLYGVLDQEGNPRHIPHDGILLPRRLLDKLNLTVGDKAAIHSYFPGKNNEENEKNVVIEGITTRYMGENALCSMDYMKKFLEEGYVANTAYIKLDDQDNQEAVIKKLKEIMTVQTIMTKKETIANTLKLMKSMNTMIMFMVAGAAALAFAIIYNITNINIFERRREIATLEVLGFTTAELKSIVFNENYFVSAFGILIGIPFGRLLFTLVMKTQETDNMQIPKVIEPGSFLLASIMIIGFTIIANNLLTGKILSIDMVESLKSSE